MLGISRTPPFRRFQRAAGNATFHINTVIVGLELVAGGGGKPVGLNINWKPPKDPRHVIEQTKQFTLLAIIVHVVDSFDVLLRDYADLNWLTLDEATTGVLRKSTTKPGGKEYSIPDRAAALLGYLKIDEPDALAFLALTTAWRNTLVHGGRAEPTLTRAADDQLRSNATWISAQYASIDVAKMLDSFWKGQRPTLKEATTMVATCQNLARTIDVAIIRNKVSTPEQISTIVRNELERSFSHENARWKKVWGRDPEAQTRAFVNQLAECGITTTADEGSVSALLQPTEVQSIALSVRAELESRTTGVGLCKKRQRSDQA
jgi:hypothetical protein